MGTLILTTKAAFAALRTRQQASRERQLSISPTVPC